MLQKSTIDELCDNYGDAGASEGLRVNAAVAILNAGHVSVAFLRLLPSKLSSSSLYFHCSL